MSVYDFLTQVIRKKEEDSSLPQFDIPEDARLKIGEKNIISLNQRISIQIYNQSFGLKDKKTGQPYFPDPDEAFAELRDLLCNSDRLAITAFPKRNKQDEFNYFLNIGDFRMSFSMSDPDKGTRIYCKACTVSDPSRAPKKRVYLIPSKEEGFLLGYHGEIQLIRNGACEDSSLSNWDMDGNLLKNIFDHLQQYFAEPEELKCKLTGPFYSNVLSPFAAYTAKEEWLELDNAANEGTLSFGHWEMKERVDLGSLYLFHADGNGLTKKDFPFKQGDTLRICTDITTQKGPKASLSHWEQDEQGDFLLEVLFNYQIDSSRIPENGFICIACNDTQTRVRRNVLKKFKSESVDSKYMYRVFDKFVPGGYKQLDPETENLLIEFIQEELKQKYPPNEMQMEAIIKGLLTEDLLLVLGPPGTGKTTVITEWVKFFLKKKMRVLISSQNNAAVDNVLARFSGAGNIIRLCGDETKVQENCREFILHNKKEELVATFDAKQAEVDALLSADEQQLRNYYSYLQKSQESLKRYRKSREQLTASVKMLFGELKQMSGLYQEQNDLGMKLGELQTRSGKLHVFLEEDKKRNPLIHLFHFSYCCKARKELRRIQRKLEPLRTQYRNAIENYNVHGEKLKRFCRANDMNARITEYRMLRQDIINRLAASPSLHLQSEIAYFFTEETLFAGGPIKASQLAHMEETIRMLFEKLKSTQSVLNDWKSVMQAKRNDVFQDLLLQTCDIVGATCIGINSNTSFANVKFDVTIVDESGQIQIHNALVPMSRAPVNLLLGDYKQIPPNAGEELVNACIADNISPELLEKSFFEYIYQKMQQKNIAKYQKDHPDCSTRDAITALLQPVLDYRPKACDGSVETIRGYIAQAVADPKKLVDLNTQFRMPSSISDVISQWFYDNNYFSGYDMARFRPIVPGTSLPLIFIDTGSIPNREETSPDGGGKFNVLEAQIAANLLKDILSSQSEEQRREFTENIGDLVGIISGYSLQVQQIRRRIKESSLGIPKQTVDGMVASLDSFQGQERDLIIYSFARSSHTDASRKRVGFLAELRRLNVAFTRCKKQLVIIGDLSYLATCMSGAEKEPGRYDDPEHFPEANCQDFPGPDTLQSFVGPEEIEQCARCTRKNCERKFSRFMRLLHQHILNGNGELLDGRIYLEGGDRV